MVPTVRNIFRVILEKFYGNDLFTFSPRFPFSVLLVLLNEPGWRHINNKCITVLGITFYDRSWCCEHFSSEAGILSGQTRALSHVHAQCAYSSTKSMEIFVEWTIHEWIKRRKNKSEPTIKLWTYTGHFISSITFLGGWGVGEG